MGGFGSFMGGLAQVAAGASAGYLEGTKRKEAKEERDRAFKLQEDEHLLHKRDSDARFNKMQGDLYASSQDWLNAVSEPSAQPQGFADVPGVGAVPTGGIVAPAPAPGTAPAPAGIMQSGVQTGKGTPANPPERFLQAAEAKKAEFQALKSKFAASWAAADTPEKKAALNERYKAEVAPIEKEATKLHADAMQAGYLQSMKMGFNLLQTGDKAGAQNILSKILPPEAVAQLDRVEPAKVYGMEGFAIKDANGKVMWQAPGAILQAMWDPTVPPSEGMKLYHDFMVAQQRFGHDEKMMAKQLAMMNKPTDREKGLAELKSLDKEYKTASPERKKEIENEIYNLKEMYGISKGERADRKADETRQGKASDRDLRAALAFLKDPMADEADRAWAESVLKGGGRGAASQPVAFTPGSAPPRQNNRFAGARPLGSNS